MYSTHLNPARRATIAAVSHGLNASAGRRRQRRSAARLYCATNGCASILEVDVTSGSARCRVCGYERPAR